MNKFCKLTLIIVGIILFGILIYVLQKKSRYNQLPMKFGTEYEIKESLELGAILPLKFNTSIQGLRSTAIHQFLPRVNPTLSYVQISPMSRSNTWLLQGSNTRLLARDCMLQSASCAMHRCCDRGLL